MLYRTLSCSKFIFSSGSFICGRVVLELSLGRRDVADLELPLDAVPCAPLPRRFVTPTLSIAIRNRHRAVAPSHKQVSSHGCEIPVSDWIAASRKGLKTLGGSLIGKEKARSVRVVAI